jgi:hypothetical protein
MSLREFLSARFGEAITLTVAPDAFIFEGLGSRARIPTQIQMSDAEPGKIAAIGEDIPDPAQGPIISLFDGPRATESGWAHESYCILFCRYYLSLFNDGIRYFLKPLVSPRVDVFGSSSLRWILAGHETVILDRVLREAGAGTVRFLHGDRPSEIAGDSPAA